MRRSSVTNRQSLVPLRVQDSNRAALATPQTKERPGLGKLSMTRPNSATSEKKISFFGKRASGARTSQYGAFGGSEKIKDPRPLHDKSFIQQCIRQLCEFLNENGYSQTITVKSLQGPSTKDFMKIFAFIYSFICPNYEIPDSNFEEEIPRIFKDLGVPPCYKDRETLLQKDLYAVDESHLESLQAESRRLMEEIEKLEKEKEREPDRLSSMRKMKASLQTDIQKYQNYLTEMESHSALLDQRVGSISEELEAVELEFEAVKQENLRLKNILDNQKYSVADIERIKYEENELNETLTKLTKELDDEKQLLWSEELKYAKIKESVETDIAEFHKLARKLRLIPSTAENANGYDLQIECNLDSEESLHHCRNKINLPLLEMLTQSEAQITKALNKKMEIQEVNEQLKSLISDKRNDVKNFKEDAQRLDDLLLQKNQDAEEQEKKWASELQSVEKHRQLLESGVNRGLDEAMKNLEKAQQELQLVEHQTEEEMRQVGNKLVRVVTAVASHVAAIEKHLEERRLRTEREYEEFMKQDMLADLREILDKYKQKAELLEKPSSD
ncbi:kinetochore protein NDC80 homolog [Pyxicephalus adspersus]